MSPGDRSPSSPVPVERAILRADGASRGNPGPAAYGFVLSDSRGVPLASEGKYLGKMTNNEAEYKGLIAGLERALALGVRDLDVRLDSELVVKHLSGAYRVRALNLLPLFQRARTLLAKFTSAKVSHVPRSQNARADALANTALDESHEARR